MPYLFIGGCGHSGTTLLLKLLGYHSQIDSPLGLKENSLALFQQDHPYYRRARKAHQNRTGKYVMYKNPSNIKFAFQARVHYPKTKIILMIRDGRDVAISCHKRNLRPTFTDCVLYWRERTIRTLRLAETKDVLVIHYEDLADHPQKTVDRICRFLQIKTENLVELYENDVNEDLKKPKSEKGSAHHQLRKWQVNQKIRKSTRWKKEMTPKQKRIFETLAGDILIRAGYSQGAAHQVASSDRGVSGSIGRSSNSSVIKQKKKQIKKTKNPLKKRNQRMKLLSQRRKLIRKKKKKTNLGQKHKSPPVVPPDQNESPNQIEEVNSDPN